MHDLASCLDAWLTDLADPAAGATLLPRYAPDAPLWVQGRVVPAREADPAGFAHEHASAPAPAWRPGPLTVLDAGGDAERPVAWFGLEEAGRSLVLGAGFERGPEGWLVAWAAFAPRPEGWDFQEGRLQTVADYGYVERAHRPTRGSWLDASYRRHYAAPDPRPLLTLPGARFGCHGSQECCRDTFEIQAGPGAQAVLDAIPWERVAPRLAGVRLEELPSGSLRIKTAGERCRFLDEEGRCVVHRAAGRAVFRACHLFPFAFQETPDGVAVTASSTCPTVRANAGEPLPLREGDLRDRLAMVPPTPFGEARLAPDTPCAWEDFRAAEAGLLALLDHQDLPLAHRLWLGNRLLDAGAPWDPMALPAVPPPDPDREARTAVVTGVLGALGLEMPDGPALVATRGFEEPFRWAIAQQLFAKRFSLALDLRTAHQVGILLFLALQHLQARHPDGPLPTPALWRVTSVFDHRDLEGLILRQPELLGWLRNPVMGDWLLAPWL